MKDKLKFAPYKDLVRALETPIPVEGITLSEGDYARLRVAIITALLATEMVSAVKAKLFYGKEYDNSKESVRQMHDRAFTWLGPKKKIEQDDMRMLHALLGMFSEAGEMLESFETHIVDDKPLDRVNMIEEIGDLGWFRELAKIVLSLDDKTIEFANRAKLLRRYAKQKFDAENAIKRDTKAERSALRVGISGAKTISPADNASPDR